MITCLSESVNCLCMHIQILSVWQCHVALSTFKRVHFLAELSLYAHTDLSCLTMSCRIERIKIGVVSRWNVFSCTYRSRMFDNVMPSIAQESRPWVLPGPERRHYLGHFTFGTALKAESFGQTAGAGSTWHPEWNELGPLESVPKELLASSSGWSIARPIASQRQGVTIAILITW